MQGNKTSLVVYFLGIINQRHCIEFILCSRIKSIKPLYASVFSVVNSSSRGFTEAIKDHREKPNIFLGIMVSLRKRIQGWTFSQSEA